MHAVGKQHRAVVVRGGQTVDLHRDYAQCPACGTGLPPLDEELGLLPGPWSPRLQEDLARLGARLPFAQAAAEFTAFTHVPVRDTTVRRHTHTAGAAYVAVQAAAVEHLERAARQPAPIEAGTAEPAGAPAVLQVSTEGAFVPLVGGEWAEVKTLAVGEVVSHPDPDDPQQMVARTTELSYFSRLADAESRDSRLDSGVDERCQGSCQCFAVGDGAGSCRLQLPGGCRHV